MLSERIEEILANWTCEDIITGGRIGLAKGAVRLLTDQILAAIKEKQDEDSRDILD